MIKARRKFVLVAFALGLLVGLALLYSSGTRRSPKLTVTYLTRTNVSGRWIAQFAITNFGDAAAISLQGYYATRQGFAPNLSRKVYLRCSGERRWLWSPVARRFTVFRPEAVMSLRFSCRRDSKAVGGLTAPTLVRV